MLMKKSPVPPVGSSGASLGSQNSTPSVTPITTPTPERKISLPTLINSVGSMSPQVLLFFFLDFKNLLIETDKKAQTNRPKQNSIIRRFQYSTNDRQQSENDAILDSNRDARSDFKPEYAEGNGEDRRKNSLEARCPAG